VDVLTEYFNAMTPIIHRYGGTIDKFIGDAIMAFWGAPLDDQQQAQHAVEAACDMQNAMLTLVQTLASRGLPGVSMRIGLHTGSVVVGNVGSQTRFSYTAIGDSVNLAARLEGANKAFGTGILLSEETAKRLPAQVMLRHLDTIIVKGKREPIRVFTPCNDAELCRFSAQALVEFYAGRWDESRTSFEAILKRRPGDLAALRFLQRIKEFGGKPPETGWSGALALEKL
jgi:adenylate cyclase